MANALRQQEIDSKFNGLNARDLTTDYGISQAELYRLLAASRQKKQVLTVTDVKTVLSHRAARLFVLSRLRWILVLLTRWARGCCAARMPR